MSIYDKKLSYDLCLCGSCVVLSNIMVLTNQNQTDPTEEKSFEISPHLFRWVKKDNKNKLV